MEIKGVSGMTREQVQLEVASGARFVVFQYCISVILMTFRRGSAVHFVRPNEGTMGRGLPFTFLTLLLGWWGIPWGPIYSIQSLVTNLAGGKDVTREVMVALGLGSAVASARPK